MSTPIQERITLAEFERLLALPENQDRQLELWAGEIIETMPTPLHSFIQQLFGLLIGNYLLNHPVGYTFPELRIRIPGEDYTPVPDVCFVSHERGTFDWDQPLPFMPDLIVEIQSPDQSDKFMRDKADYYLTHGCRRVVLVYSKRIVEVLTPDERQLLNVDDTLSGGDVLPGFRVEVAKLFPAQA